MLAPLIGQGRGVVWGQRSGEGGGGDGKGREEG